MKTERQGTCSPNGLGDQVEKHGKESSEVNSTGLSGMPENIMISDQVEWTSMMIISPSSRRGLAQVTEAV